MLHTSLLSLAAPVAVPGSMLTRALSGDELSCGIILQNLVNRSRSSDNRFDVPFGEKLPGPRAHAAGDDDLDAEAEMGLDGGSGTEFQPPLFEVEERVGYAAAHAHIDLDPGRLEGRERVGADVPDEQGVKGRAVSRVSMVVVSGIYP
jgi:hypothetical protein